ncbi:hypothetical protein [Pontibacter liquoris]|uniref:hypothetical protein n=1 Tax=Pontibacter liquoris TaxID=2905677 RepID=UPI001FA804F3|nr:hypothetical protein [Pontibacter liquoris]
MKSKNILFLTTNNLTTNPRLLKEVKVAVEAGYLPTVVLFDFDNWTNNIEHSLRESLEGVKFITIPATRKNLLSWLFSSGVQYGCRKVYKFLKFSRRVNAFASDKRSYLLNRSLESLPSSYDFIISHNLGSLYPAYNFAEKYTIPFAFDIEDYHPGEMVSRDAGNEKERREFILKKLLPTAAYVSYASPLIGEATFSFIHDVSEQKRFLLNNAFSLLEFQQPKSLSNSRTKLVWFSQNIAAGRGLELVIPVLYSFRDRVKLTLIGNLIPEFYEAFLKQYDDVIEYREPLPQSELHLQLANYDIGLAIEISRSDINKDIALSNKLIAYAQAGLFVLATDTRGQALFIDEHPQIGSVFQQSTEGFETAFRQVLAKLQPIREAKQTRFAAARELAWEKEAEKLTEIWQTF